MYHYRKEGHQRRSIRLQDYDYSQEGWYFITICCQDRAHLFGEIINGEIVLNEAGQMIESEWLKLKLRFPNIHCHQYVIMPDHFHAILEIIVGTTTVTVGNIIGAFKSITTVEYIRGVKSLGWPPFNKRLWQRNYYEHIIRNDLAFWRITEYIKNNPKSWEEHQISKKRKNNK